MREEEEKVARIRPNVLGGRRLGGDSGGCVRR